MLGSLRAACDEMGAVLVRSAHSANIKERRDASTALFDADGQMVMQAEHIPVHLGAMPSAVAAVLDEEQRPGESWILNDPYRGGTHLPDITVITPLFHDGEPAGFAASRAHHADVGAEEPGSMPALSRTLADEGVVIPPTRLTDEVLHELAGRMRNPRQREADLRAQLAAGRAGGERVAALIERFGFDTVRAGMRETLDYAERRTRARIAELEDGVREARDVLEAAEGDLELRVTARVEGDGIEFDFTGSAPQHDGNLNCPLAVTLSACYFALRVLTDPDVPPCSGAYRPLTVTAPEGSLLNARSPAAVAAGNVETSSRVADLVLARLRARARTGDDEQHHARERPLHLLRDPRRRPGRLRGRRRPERRARGDVEHPQHAHRGARARVPPAGGRVRPPARLRRGGSPAWRRRGDSRAGGARRDALFADHRAPPAFATGCGRRRARPSW